VQRRTWIVTGGSRGFGRAVAERASAAGDRVALIARGAEVRDVAAAIGDDTIGVVADVRDADAMNRAVGEVAARWGRVDVLVNNAGLHRGGLIDQLDPADWRDVLATNLGGPFDAVRAVLPHMPGGGSIVNVGAVVGFRGFAGDAAYGASKAGLAGLTVVLAAELARRQVRVNLVIPGFVSTEMTAAISDRARERLVERIPLGREGAPEEIAEVIWWVAGSTYMTGSTIATDGGLMCSL
jgi:3-oxoacyl-[acyl-carrier protein] reductase